MALATEVAELMEHFLWLTGDESRQACADPAKREAIADELADVACLVLQFSVSSGIDLAEALRANALGGAGLDVFTSEPLPADSTLRDAPNLIVTPHAAWYSDVAIERLQALAANDITRALRGEAPRRPVQG
jgi:hypothetical protein